MCSLCAGLNPISDSFDMMRPEYLRSIDLNDSLVDGFAAFMQDNVLNHMVMSYCMQSEEVSCDIYTVRTVICKVPCEISGFSTASFLFLCFKQDLYW